MLLILPTQLFPVKFLGKYKKETIILYEHPNYFTKYNFNKRN